MKNINKIVIFILLGMVTTFNLQAEIITHNGFTYGTVTSPYTGRVWLDRNLGASQVCTAYSDSACYGDYYQWGRGTDGHEKADSSITSTQATDVINVNNAGKFITSSSSYVYDWAKDADSDGSIRSAKWNPCPSGYRIPTIDELLAENISGRADAYSKLKLPSAGYRYNDSGSLYLQGSNGYLWSSSLNGSVSRYLYFGSSRASSYGGSRVNGFSVRCIKDNTPQNQLPTSNAGADQTTYKGNPVTLSASNSTDSDGNITAYLWSENGTVLSSDVNFTKYDFSVGVHTITLKVTDDDNASSEANVTVTINDFPQENIYANGTFTNSIDYLNTKRVYTFTLDEKSQVNIKTSSDVMQVGAWVIDANNTKISRLSNWEAGDKNQFAYEGILEAGMYRVEFFPQDYGNNGIFSFTFDTKAYSTLMQNPWTINIPKNITIANNEIVNIGLDIQANYGVSLNSKNLEISSNDLPNGFSIIKTADRYNEKQTFSLEGKIETTDNFAITLHITDGNITREHIINFSVQNIIIDGIIGDGIGEKMVIKQDENNVTKPFKVAFNIRGVDENDVESVVCLFRETPILSKEIFSKTYYRENDNFYGKYICDIGERAFTRGASSSEDFMNKLVAIDDTERFLIVVINLKDGTTIKKRILQTIPIEKFGGYIRIREWTERTLHYDSSMRGNIYIYKKDGSYLSYSNQDIKGKEFLIDYGDEVRLDKGRWTIEVDNHEFFVNTELAKCGGVSFKATEDIVNNDILLNLGYISMGEGLELYAQTLHNEKVSGLVKTINILSKAGSIWTKATNLDDECQDPFDTNAIAAIRGTTFKMTLTDSGVDYDLYEGAIDINDSGKIAKLKTMQSYKSDTSIMKRIVDFSVPLPVKTYFDNTSLYQADLNTTVSKLDITTNRDDASYILVGDNVRFGGGRLNSINNITEGNYTLKFLPVLWNKKPSDINITFDAQNIKENITSTYQKIVDVVVNGVNQDRVVDINISKANIKIDQLEDASIFAITTLGDKNSSINFSTLDSTINVDVNGTTVANIPLATNVKIAIAKDGQVKPTISGALLPKEDFPLGTEVKIIDNKVRFIIPMNQTLEF